METAWRGRRAEVVALVAVLGAARPAPAEVALPPVRVEAPREADSTSFVTVVPGGSLSARSVSVAELIEREAGVRVRSAGGLGAFTAVSIRGSDAGEVAIFLDGVPLNRASASSVDLSTLPVDAIERIEIYRGMPPPELSGASVGGAINLISRQGQHGPAWRGSVGTGSFGARSASAGYGFGGRPLRGDASLAYHGARGDFTYYDNNGTIGTADDHQTTRQNNAFDQVAADVSVSGQTGTAATFRLGSHAVIKSQGVPSRGSEGAETSAAHYTSSRLVVDGELQRRLGSGRGGDLRASAYLLFERFAFNNRSDELVGPNGAARSDGETLSVGGDVRARLAVGSHQILSAMVALTAEHFTPYDLLRPDKSPAGSTRLRGSLVLSDDLRLLGDRLALTPSLRLEGLVNQLATALSTSGLQAMGSNATSGLVTAQIGLRHRPRPWLTWKASIGRYVRIPTTVELFGNGAFILPQPSLKPEASLGADLGGALQGERGALSGMLELAVFGRLVSDYIGLGPSARGFAAQNFGDQRFVGVEARGRARLFKHVAVSGAYTLIHSTTTSDVRTYMVGNALPNLPEHKLDARLDAAVAPFAAFYELAYTSDVRLDGSMASGHVILGRALHAIGARFGPIAGLPLTLSAEVRNLADLRVVQKPLGGSINGDRSAPMALVDFFEYPLPGRAFYLTLSWQP